MNIYNIYLKLKYNTLSQYQHYLNLNILIIIITRKKKTTTITTLVKL